MAKLPNKLLEKAKPKLKSIKVGDTVYVTSADMCVTQTRDCYLEPTAEYRRKPSSIDNLRVKRASDGFHVTVLTNAKWKPGRGAGDVENCLPVASIELDLDPELDLDIRLKRLQRMFKKRNKKMGKQIS